MPKRIPDKWAAIVYPIICSLHGFAFGALYAPAKALTVGFSFKQTLAWIAAGFVYDIIHGVSNFALGLLILPLSKLIRRLMR